MRKILIVTGLLALAFVGLVGSQLWPPRVPQEAIATAVTRTPALMERAWRLPVAATFKDRIAWQSNPSLCGPASLANVFRSLGEANATESAVLEGTGTCWTGYCILGLTLDELADLAKAKTNRRVSVLRDLGPEEFLEHLRRSNDLSRRYVINFSRAAIFGSGTGHHSPIGGYLEEEDLVLVLDVNGAFKPWLIERSRLFAAMNTQDGDRKRGLLLIKDLNE